MKQVLAIFSVFLLSLQMVCAINDIDGAGIHDILQSLSRKELEQWAMAAENYHKEVNHIEWILVGLVNRIKLLTDQELKNYIQSEVNEHPELDSHDKFKTLLRRYGFSNTGGEELENLEVANHIQTLSRKDLITWALAAEKYHKEVLNIKILGGLHDRVRTITREELLDYIVKEIKEHKEMNSIAFFKTIIKKYNLEKAKLLGGGVHDYVQALSRRDLISWALAAERYHRDVFNMTFIMGGLHDRLNSITREELINYIMKETEDHVELDVGFFKTLVKQYDTAKPKRLGEGIHDHLLALPKKELIRWALAAETHHRRVYNQTFIMGGLHDYVDKLSREELISYLMKESQEHPEMDSVEFFKNIAVKYKFAVKAPVLLGGGIHDHIMAMSRSELISWALAAEKHEQEVLGVGPILGGLHDYIETLSREELMKYIVDKTKKYPELNSVEAFNRLLSKHKLARNTLLGGGIHDHLVAMTKEELVDWALASEKYHREVYNMTNIDGGIHDYAHTLSKEQLITYITKKVDEHPEMDSKQFFDTILKRYGFIKEKMLGEGIHDYVVALNRGELINWALAAEAHHREVYNKTFIYGGIHDRIRTISREELLNYIWEEVEEHAEMDSVEFFQNAMKKYGFVKQDIDGGLHDIIPHMSRQQLEKLAMTCENYHREVFNLGLILGGLHDYIKYMSDAEVVKFITNEIDDHPELNNLTFLKSTVEKYGFKNVFEADQSSPNVEKVTDYIFNLPRETLTKWALAVETYEREVKKIPIRGGIHDYINRLENRDIALYILKKAEKYPELNSREFLDKISSK